MINEENTALRVVIAIFNILSIMGCSIILWTIKNTPRLSKNPGSIIQRIAIFQIACSFQLFFSQFYFQEKPKDSYTHGIAFVISDPFCDVIGFLQIWIGTQYIFYNIFFVSNLYFSLKIQQYNFTNFFKTMEYLGFLIAFFISLTALLTQNIGIGVIGQCGVENTKLEIVMAGSMCFILISTLILIILISTIKGSIDNQLYETDSDKFQKKYKKEFIRVNILYSVVFLVTHLTPVKNDFNFFFQDLYLLIYWMANDFQTQNQTYIAKEILLLNISIAGILLFAIRMHDPLVYKYFIKSIQSQRPKSLKRKLINKSDSQVTIEVENKSILRERLAYSQEQEPTVYRMTNPVLSNDQFAINQSLQPLKLMKQKSVVSLFQSKYELVQIIIAIKFQLLKQIPLLNLKPFLPYNFINMVKTDVFLKHNVFQLEELIQKREHQNQKIDFYIDSESEQNKIIIFSYASKILIDWLSQYFGLDIKCLQESLNLEQNIEKIVNQYFDLCQRGTIYITHDCLLSIDIITREQKIILTKGGALLNICKRWYEESTNTQDEGGSLLPSILGVYSINLEDGRCINVVLRLNIPKIDYPLYDDSWVMMKENNYDPLVRNNIIGWIQITSNQKVELFKPKYIYDGKFQIQLTKNDFKLNSQGQKNLISTLKKDLNYQFITNKITLTFVYFKFTSKRLESIVKHEEKNERVELMDSLENSIKLQCKQTQKNIGTFELDSKIGYVKVFFDQLWNEPYIQLQQEVRDTLYEGLIEKVTEII